MRSSRPSCSARPAARQDKERLRRWLITGWPWRAAWICFAEERWPPPLGTPGGAAAASHLLKTPLAHRPPKGGLRNYRQISMGMTRWMYTLAGLAVGRLALTLQQARERIALKRLGGTHVAEHGSH